jgi:hypothetical protein
MESRLKDVIASIAARIEGLTEELKNLLTLLEKNNITYEVASTDDESDEEDIIPAFLHDIIADWHTELAETFVNMGEVHNEEWTPSALSELTQEADEELYDEDDEGSNDA